MSKPSLVPSSRRDIEMITRHQFRKNEPYAKEDFD